MTLEQLLDKFHETGWQFFLLSQNARDYTWFCDSVKKGRSSTEGLIRGTGHTPSAAVDACLAGIKKGGDGLSPGVRSMLESAMQRNAEARAL